MCMCECPSNVFVYCACLLLGWMLNPLEWKLQGIVSKSAPPERAGSALKY